MSDDAKCKASTPAATLEQHITDSNVPKNEAEWWAYDEITRLREENARLREALKPFAEAFESDYAEQEEDHWDLWESAAASILTYGHLRAAAAAIREGGE